MFVNIGKKKKQINNCRGSSQGETIWCIDGTACQHHVVQLPNRVQTRVNFTSPLMLPYHQNWYMYSRKTSFILSPLASCRAYTAHGTIFNYCPIIFLFQLIMCYSPPWEKHLSPARIKNCCFQFSIKKKKEKKNKTSRFLSAIKKGEEKGSIEFSDQIGCGKWR